MKPSTPISRIGERKLIERIARACRNSRPSPYWRPEVPLGDDAFVAKMSSIPSLVITTDTLLEGTHFRLDWKGLPLKGIDLWQALGHKAMASNLSDLAAMGHVTPLFAFVTLGLHGDNSVNNVDNLYRGILNLSRLFRFSVTGGDIIRSDKSMISITVVGRKLSPNVIRRLGAKKGDVLMASGPLGLSSAGLEVLQKGTKMPRSMAQPAQILVRSHLFPMPKLQESALLGDKSNLATAMMDTSDDLYTSLETLAASSGVGFEVELGSVPVPPALRAAAKTFRTSPVSYILYGGEDYQLLFTARPENAPIILKKLPASYILGKATDRKAGLRLLENGRPWSGRDRRFKHF